MRTGDIHHDRHRKLFCGVRVFCFIFFSLSAISCGDPPAESPKSVAKKNPSTPAPNGEKDSANRRTSFWPPVLFAGPEFALTDQAGAEFGTKELAGRAWIVNFMFTHCTATCPRQTAKLAEIQQLARRWPDWDRVRLVSITVDPARDTPERLQEYAETHQADHEHWKFLTGDRSELWRISKEGFKFPVSEASADSSSPFAHSPRFVLVDAQRKIRGFYDSLADDDVAKLVVDLRSVLSEPTADTAEQIHLGVPRDVFDPPWMEQRKAAQLATANEFSVYHDFEFEDHVETSGIQFVNRGVADVTRNFKANHYDHANGIVVADVDGDALYDLYLISQVGGNQLWRNLGNGRFENFTAEAGVALEDRVSVSASFADTDNDGDSDLFVTTTRHGNVFFENDGHGHFRDVSEEAGLDYVGHSSSADFFDYDRDGRLDLFLSNVGVFTTDEIGYSGDPDKQKSPYYIGMPESFAGHLFSKRSERSILYHNDGENRFRDVSEEMGIVHKGWSGDATVLDANDDGWLDLYVLNMQGNDEYYENVEGQRFERLSEKSFPNAVWGGMGIKSLDYNNDGRLDLFITNMHADMWQPPVVDDDEKEKQKPPQNVMPESFLRSRDPQHNILGNALYENEGGGKYRDVSDQTNAETYWPWGPSIGDLNADGYQDVFVASCMNYPFRYHVNSLLLNDRGQKFRDAEFLLGVEPRRNDKSAAPWFELDCSGADAEHENCQGRSGRVVVWGAVGSRSSVIFDLDRDGDLDIVTNDFNTAPMVLISNLSERKPDLRYLSIQLRGTRSNRDGIGAKVQVTAGGKVFTQMHDGQSGYLSQSVLPLYFGLGDAQMVEKVSIQWPSGEQQILEGPVPPNQQLRIVETVSLSEATR